MLLNKFKADVGHRVNEIIKEADDRLNYFYSVYGEWDGEGHPPKRKGNKVNKKKCHHFGCPKMLSKDSEEIYCKDHKKKKMINLDEVDPFYKNRPGRPPKINLDDDESPVKPLPAPTPTQEPEPKAVSLKGLKARDIVNLVKEKTGRLITISIKSKKVIVKHATGIFEAMGFTVKF